jgi:L-ascorbate metabolism protein UlaG (beta-lactamase superfamily)
MKIINYGHACFKIIVDGVSIFFDPFKDGYVPNLKLPINLESNYVFISHDHHDHNAIELLKHDNVGQLKVKTIEVPHDKENGIRRGFNKIHIIEINNKKIVHFGDTGVITPEILDIRSVDVLFVPINGFYTISSVEATEIINKINPKIAIPMHYFNKKHNSGYEDNNQIEIFKQLNKNYKEIDDTFIETKEEKGILIFDNSLSDYD